LKKHWIPGQARDDDTDVFVAFQNCHTVSFAGMTNRKKSDYRLLPRFTLGVFPDAVKLLFNVGSQGLRLMGGQDFPGLFQ
jgi:hypothetical protein